MNHQYINITLMPPEKPDMKELSFEEELEQYRQYARANLKIEDVFDTYNHDMAVSFPFAEYLSYHYVTVRTEQGYRHKQHGNYYTTSQVWEQYCNQPENKQP